MLSAPHRLVDTADHKLVARRGRKGRSGPVVVSVLSLTHEPAVDVMSRASVVVPKRVGTSVQRNRVQRQLRHLLRERLPQLPASELTVVRAEPGAGGLSSPELAAHLDRALAKAHPGVRMSALAVSNAGRPA